MGSLAVVVVACPVQAAVAVHSGQDLAQQAAATEPLAEAAAGKAMA
jgi:hypothetical protein